MSDADDAHTTHPTPANHARPQAELEPPAPPNEHLKRAGRQHKLDAGFALARALGNDDARQALHAAGWIDGARLVPLNLGGLEILLPAEDVVLAAFELANTPVDQWEAVTAAWRSTAEVYADPELHAALTRDHSEDPDPIEVQPTAGQRARWEAAAASRGQSLEAFLIAAADAAAQA